MDAFIKSNFTKVHKNIHKLIAESTMQGDSQLVRTVKVRCLAQGHLKTQLGGAGD